MLYLAFYKWLMGSTIIANTVHCAYVCSLVFVTSRHCVQVYCILKTPCHIHFQDIDREFMRTHFPEHTWVSGVTLIHGIGYS